MKLYFVSKGKRTLIKEIPKFELVDQEINKYLKEHGIKHYYTIVTSHPDKFEYDFGSHTEFFEVDGYTRDEARAYFTKYEY